MRVLLPRKGGADVARPGALGLREGLVVGVEGPGPEVAGDGVEDPAVGVLVPRVGRVADDDYVLDGRVHPEVVRGLAHVLAVGVDELAPGPVAGVELGGELA